MVRKNFRLSLIAASVALVLSSAAGAAGNQKAHADALTRLSSDTGGAAEVSISAATGKAHFVRAKKGGWLATGMGPTDAAKHDGSKQFLNRYGAVFGITDADSELSAKPVTKDRHGHSRVVHQQMHRGVPVFGAELRTHFDRSNHLVAVSGNFVPGVDVDVTPSRSADDAAGAAAAFVKGSLAERGDSFADRGAGLVATTPKLVVYRDGLLKGTEGKNSLAWYLTVTNGRDVREFVFVDAHSGKVLQSFTGIHDAKNRRAFDGAGAAAAPGPNYPANPFWVEGDAFPTGNTEADNMIAASSEIYDLFKNAFGRDSFDGSGARMDSIFNRGWGCVNASWNGTYISFCPGTTTDDVTGHEWAHAYTEYTHGLIYAWQPGALNESYSDIWGETLDRINGRGGDTPDNARTAGACTVFTAPPPTTTINTPAALAGTYVSGGASGFGPQAFNLTGNVALAKNAANQPSLGCNTGNTIANPGDLVGKIALINRGTCSFVEKALNAQNAGAIGMIIANNAGGNTIQGMGGVSGAITIPAVLIGTNTGTAIRGQLASNVAVNTTLTRTAAGADNSVRWLMGEDSTAFGGAIRDMYNPQCYSNPGKVTDTTYTCDPNFTDQGGVHTNSGVPNHAYALLVDGGVYNGQSIASIGLTKAAHIYYRAQSVYQGPASDFAAHADAIEHSCRDLTGVNLNHLKTGAPSGEIITASDCAQVAKAAQAVELRTPPSQCNFAPVLAKNPPALCPSGSPTNIISDSFEGGRVGGLRWTVSNAPGAGSQFTPRNFGVVKNLPGGRAGYAMYASDPDNSCAFDQTGLQRLESPEFTVPAGASDLRMTFDHFVATEPDWDGANLKISVNGGPWTLIGDANIIYNKYNKNLLTAGQGNTNPLAGQPAWSGTDAGSVTGSWGRSIINLAPYAAPGAKVKLRFELGNDLCSGSFGWYVDDVKVYSCPVAN